MQIFGVDKSADAEVRPADLRRPVPHPKPGAHNRLSLRKNPSLAAGASPLSRASPRWAKFGLSHNQLVALDIETRAQRIKRLHADPLFRAKQATASSERLKRVYAQAKLAQHRLAKIQRQRMELKRLRQQIAALRGQVAPAL